MMARYGAVLFRVFDYTPQPITAENVLVTVVFVAYMGLVAGATLWAGRGR
jgi:hypothetical protein